MKALISIMVALLMGIGIATAVSDISYSVYSPSGGIDIETYFNVGGFDSQSQTTQMTSSDYQHITNVGTLYLANSALSYGTGLAYPNRNSAAQGYGDTGFDYGEWSGMQTTGITTTGATSYVRGYTVNTVHPEWWTNYEFSTELDTPTTSTGMAGAGTIYGNAMIASAMYSNIAQDPYEAYTIHSYSFTNPFVGESAFGYVG